MTKILDTPVLGTTVEILHSTNSNQIGIKGLVIDETRNTITVSDSNSKKSIYEKKMLTLKIEQEDGNKNIYYGASIVGRPYDRIKKAARRRK
ncbi:MAG: ribonuclease P protein subunit [Candidatus Ranarchaeia archaeon]